MAVTIYYEKDADLKDLEGKSVCVLGYGSQGRAHARNLTDSGLEVIVGLREGSSTFAKCEADGVKAGEISQACADADLIAFLVPDPSQPAVYEEFVRPSLKPGKTLLFSHGFNIHYGQIVPPPEVNVVMIAPKGPGKLVRDLYEEGQGVPCLIALHQDISGDGRKQALAYALGIGGARAGVIETDFKEETETDLFGEQAVLCGGASALIKAGFDTLVNAGYAPEMAYFEVCHELKLIVDLIYQGGLEHMRHFISDTAKYGDITRGPRVIDEEVRLVMQEILEDIQNGDFAREWILENQANRPVYNALLKREAGHPIEKVGSELRAMMSWLGKSK